MPYDWVKVCVEKGIIWDIGQLSRDDKLALTKAVRSGILVKEYDYWQSIGPKRACWMPVGTDA